jgi:hypothetical protein
MIPTCEEDWDFGLGTVTIPAPLGGGEINFKRHVNEAGEVANNYTRVEARLYFNAEDGEGKWDFYSALEYDAAVDQPEVDSRGRDYGLERLQGSVLIPGLEKVRLHAGWDIYYLDAVDAGAGFIYGDDDPGIWITGDFDFIEVQAGWHKKFESNFASRTAQDLNEEAGVKSDEDRDLLDVMLKFNFAENHWLKLMGSFDNMKTRSQSALVPANDQKGADVQTYRVGALWKGNFGILEPEAEFAYQFGTADNAVDEFGNSLGDYDIKAYAAYADLAFNLTDAVGFKLMPHIGFMYTSGDDDPDDDNLEGYCAVANAQRFTPRFGGEDTIIGDNNTLLGTILYGYIPELYGNLGGSQAQGGVATGGLTNGSIGGRGDNPGMTMYGGGITIEPKEFISFRTLFMWIEWNEDFQVFSPLTGTNVEVKAGTAGQQWSNSLRVSLNRNVHLFGNATFFFPGEAVEDVTQDVYGKKSDDTAQRYALVLMWRF